MFNLLTLPFIDIILCSKTYFWHILLSELLHLRFGLRAYFRPTKQVLLLKNPIQYCWMTFIFKGILCNILTFVEIFWDSYCEEKRVGNKNVRKSNRFNKQNNNFTHAECFLLCDDCINTRWKFLKRKKKESFLLFLNLGAVPKNSTPRKFTYSWLFEHFWIIHFNKDVSAVITVVVALAKTKLSKLADAKLAQYLRPPCV